MFVFTPLTILVAHLISCSFSSYDDDANVKKGSPLLYELVYYSFTECNSNRTYFLLASVIMFFESFSVSITLCYS